MIEHSKTQMLQQVSMMDEVAILERQAANHLAL
jgi:hypothetical protein